MIIWLPLEAPVYAYNGLSHGYSAVYIANAMLTRCKNAPSGAARVVFSSIKKILQDATKDDFVGCRDRQPW